MTGPKRFYGLNGLPYLPSSTDRRTRPESQTSNTEVCASPPLICLSMRYRGGPK